MTRSFKKIPITGIAKTSSEKDDKRESNRKLRRKVRQNLEEEDKIPLLREVSDVWVFKKDGKSYVKNNEKVLRK